MKPVLLLTIAVILSSILVACQPQPTIITIVVTATKEPQVDVYYIVNGNYSETRSWSCDEFDSAYKLWHLESDGYYSSTVHNNYKDWERVRASDILQICPNFGNWIEPSINVDYYYYGNYNTTRQWTCSDFDDYQKWYLIGEGIYQSESPNNGRNYNRVKGSDVLQTCPNFSNMIVK